MEYKLKPTISKYKFFGIKLDKQQLFCLFLCAVLVVLFIQTYRITGSWWGPLYWWCKEMQLAWHEGELLGSFGIFLVGLGALFFVGGNIYHATMWRTIPLGKEDEFKKIDFQPTSLVLWREKPVVLPYDQTALRLNIHIGTQRTQDSVVKEVFLLTLCFTHQKDIYICNNFCGKEGIFPLLDYADRFASFSYKFINDLSTKEKEIAISQAQGNTSLFQDNPSNIQAVQYYAKLLQNTHNSPFSEESNDSLQEQPVSRVLNSRLKSKHQPKSYSEIVKQEIQQYLKTHTETSLSADKAFDYTLDLIFGMMGIIFLMWFFVFSESDSTFLWIALPPSLLGCILCAYRAVQLLHYYRNKKKLSQLEK